MKIFETKISILTILLIVFSISGNAQDYKENFEKFRVDNDSLSQIKLLTEWEKENPNDAELYTSYFNF